jgi:hypothetical protein
MKGLLGQIVGVSFARTKMLDPNSSKHPQDYE